MNDDKWFRASLRISGEDLRPDEITRLLGIAPTRVHLRGEPRGHGKSCESVWERSLWLLQSPLGDSRDPVEHLDWLMRVLESKRSAVKGLRGKYAMDLFCGFSSETGQGGFTLDAVTVHRLGRLGLPLSFDLYPLNSSLLEE